MKDLDFDELDKAVNSLMGGTGGSGAPPETGEAKPKESQVATANPSETPAISAAPSPRPTETSSRPAPAARRAGRFMDVVHPSSEMKKPVPSRPISRLGATIEPSPSLSNLDDENEQEITSLPAQEAITSAASVAPSVAEDTQEKLADRSSGSAVVSGSDPEHVKSAWPDPLEFGPHVVSEVDSSEPAEPEVAPKKEDTPPSEESAPLTSPFLPDAKVEKRPLGGAAVTASAEQDDLTVVDTDAQLPALTKDVEPALPEELHSDVVAIESEGRVASPDEDGSVRDDMALTPKGAPSQAERQPKAEGANTVREVSGAEATLAKASGPVSIPQQYKEAPSNSGEESGAIYDTDNYHKPLAHPAKKKSGWMWVVWIILILLLGAAVGAGLYLMGIVSV